MSAYFGPAWADPRYLRESQYRTEVNLASRQSIYKYQQPRFALPGLAFDLAGLTGDEVVADVGCGNGGYRSALSERGHRGPVIGVDLSAGMLMAVKDHRPEALLAQGNVCDLPLRAASADVALAMHMLYHAPDPALALSRPESSN